MDALGYSRLSSSSLTLDLNHRPPPPIWRALTIKVEIQMTSSRVQSKSREISEIGVSWVLISMHWKMHRNSWFMLLKLCCQFILDQSVTKRMHHPNIKNKSVLRVWGNSFGWEANQRYKREVLLNSAMKNPLPLSLPSWDGSKRRLPSRSKRRRQYLGPWYFPMHRIHGTNGRFTYTWMVEFLW